MVKVGELVESMQEYIPLFENYLKTNYCRWCFTHTRRLPEGSKVLQMGRECFAVRRSRHRDRQSSKGFATAHDRPRQIEAFQVCCAYLNLF